MHYNFELHIPPEKKEINPKTGRFLKGHTPHNKERKQKEYMNEKTANRIKENLKYGRICHKSRMWKSVIAVKNGKIIGVFETSVDAAKKMNMDSSNIRRCCHGERKSSGNIQWFFENEVDKWRKLIDNK